MDSPSLQPCFVLCRGGNASPAPRRPSKPVWGHHSSAQLPWAREWKLGEGGERSTNQQTPADSGAPYACSPAGSAGASGETQRGLTQRKEARGEALSPGTRAPARQIPRKESLRLADRSTRGSPGDSSGIPPPVSSDSPQAGCTLAARVFPASPPGNPASPPAAPGCRVELVATLPCRLPSPGRSTPDARGPILSMRNRRP